MWSSFKRILGLGESESSGSKSRAAEVKQQRTVKVRPVRPKLLERLVVDGALNEEEKKFLRDINQIIERINSIEYEKYDKIFWEEKAREEAEHDFVIIKTMEEEEYSQRVIYVQREKARKPARSRHYFVDDLTSTQEKNTGKLIISHLFDTLLNSKLKNGKKTEQDCSTIRNQFEAFLNEMQIIQDFAYLTARELAIVSFLTDKVIEACSKTLQSEALKTVLDNFVKKLKANRKTIAKVMEKQIEVHKFTNGEHNDILLYFKHYLNELFDELIIPVSTDEHDDNSYATEVFNSPFEDKEISVRDQFTAYIASVRRDEALDGDWEDISASTEPKSPKAVGNAVSHDNTPQDLADDFVIISESAAEANSPTAVSNYVIEDDTPQAPQLTNIENTKATDSGDPADDLSDDFVVIQKSPAVTDLADDFVVIQKLPEIHDQITAVNDANDKKAPEHQSTRQDKVSNFSPTSAAEQSATKQTRTETTFSRIRHFFANGLRNCFSIGTKSPNSRANQAENNVELEFLKAWILELSKASQNLTKEIKGLSKYCLFSGFETKKKTAKRKALDSILVSMSTLRDKILNSEESAESRQNLIDTINKSLKDSNVTSGFWFSSRTKEILNAIINGEYPKDLSWKLNQTEFLQRILDQNGEESLTFAQLKR